MEVKTSACVLRQLTRTQEIKTRNFIVLPSSAACSGKKTQLSEGGFQHLSKGVFLNYWLKNKSKAGVWSSCRDPVFPHWTCWRSITPRPRPARFLSMSHLWSLRSVPFRNEGHSRKQFIPFFSTHMERKVISYFFW